MSSFAFLSSSLLSPGLIIGVHVHGNGKWRTRHNARPFLLPSASTRHRQMPCRALHLTSLQPAVHERLSFLSLSSHARMALNLVAIISTRLEIETLH